jgi:potassium-transporting ATPase ATP-binding subunit
MSATTAPPTERPQRTVLETQQRHVQNVGRISAGVFNPRQLVISLLDALRKLGPRHQLRNPVMFVVWVGSVLVTVLSVVRPSVFSFAVAGWLWLTVLFANLAEAVVEGRGKAQADTLRRTRGQTMARRLRADGSEQAVPGVELRPGDLVVVEAGQLIPGDGDIVEGIATVDESAITGESAPVAHPDHDRRVAVGDRHRRHGPAGAAQRASDVRPRGGGGRRRGHPAAGQDRHDHLRQPAPPS